MIVRRAPRTESRIEHALRVIRLAGPRGCTVRQLARSQRVSNYWAEELAMALDEAGLIDFASRRCVARPPDGMPEDVRFDQAVRLYQESVRAALAARR